MKNLFKHIQKDSVLSWTFWLTMTLIFLMVALIGIFYANLPPFLPLFNQMPWGYGRLAHQYELFLIPGGVLIISLVNTILGIKIGEKVPLLARFLFLTMVGLALFSCIFLLRLIFLVL